MLLDHPVVSRGDMAAEHIGSVVAVTVQFPGRGDWIVTGVLTEVANDVDAITDDDYGYLVVDPIPGDPGGRVFAVPLPRVVDVVATAPRPQQLHPQAGLWLADMLVAWAGRHTGTRLGDLADVDRAEGLALARALSRVCGGFPGGEGERYEGELVELAEAVEQARGLVVAWRDWHEQRETLLSRYVRRGGGGVSR